MAGRSGGTALNLRQAGALAKSKILKITVGAERVRDVKGYGFALTFDSEIYEYVGAQVTAASLISPSGSAALLVDKNQNTGRAAVGAVQVDGSSATGDGDLVELTFRKIGENGPVGFTLTEGVIVDLGGQATSVSDRVLNPVTSCPVDFSVSQNVPNPFNPETTISHQLPESGRVVLTVYTSQGQEVGTYTIRWDGRDAVGGQVASGVYFYKMRTADFSDSKRMMLLK